MTEIKGTRVPVKEDTALTPGQYGRDSFGTWQWCPPPVTGERLGEPGGVPANAIVTPTGEGRITVGMLNDVDELVPYVFDSGRWRGSLVDGVWIGEDL